MSAASAFSSGACEELSEGAGADSSGVVSLVDGAVSWDSLDCEGSLDLEGAVEDSGAFDSSLDLLASEELEVLSLSLVELAVLDSVVLLSVVLSVVVELTSEVLLLDGVTETEGVGAT